MGKGDYPGEFETLVLLAILRLGKNAYGMTIRHEIIDQTGRGVSRGATYSTLDRLEEKGYVSSWLADPTPERGGRAKRYYRIEATGQHALHASLRALRGMTQGLEPVWMIGGSA